ncbi:MAG: class II aldolase/adducin family protein [Bryobacteraceae bacterium]|nr:class II aldolase/adducin family protein [Bryobacteraceae bacterium]
MRLREQLVAVAHSLYVRGYTFGTAGNISVREGERILISPTNSSFGSLKPGDLAEVSLTGEPLPGPSPSKEAHFHLAAYRARPEAGAVVHLHSCHATAVSCLADLDMDDALPVYTPYFAMRLPCLPVAEYYPPGDPALAPSVEAAAANSPALLLRNHGSIATGRTLQEASALAEEIEEQARLYFLLGARGRALTPEQVAELRRRFR